MEMEQLFGQPSNYQDEKPLLEVSNITGLLILGLISFFFFIFIGYRLNLKHNNSEFVETMPALTLAPNKTGEQTTIQAQINRVPTATTQVVTQNAWQSKILEPNAKTVKAIYQAVLEEFQYDLLRWQAEIDQTFLTIRFFHPDSLFEVGNSSLNQHYQSILANFFPRYVNRLIKHQSAIEALSIEGHTSSEWRHSVSQDQTYFNNMALSQTRTRAVLEYCLQLPSVKPDKDWLQSILTANGFANSRSIKENGIEKVEYSRRVEFRIHVHPQIGNGSLILKKQ